MSLLTPGKYGTDKAAADGASRLICQREIKQGQRKRDERRSRSDRDRKFKPAWNVRNASVLSAN